MIMPTFLQLNKKCFNIVLNLIFNYSNKWFSIENYIFKLYQDDEFEYFIESYIKFFYLNKKCFKNIEN